MAAKLTSLLGEKLLTTGGVEVPTSENLDGKVACILYFSAHWCPPCRGFTPEFAAAYEGYKKSGSAEAEVVFISWDKSVEHFNQYFAEMPWMAVPFEGTEELRKNLNEKFELRGIPSLVALGPDGSRLDADLDLRSLVSMHKSDAFPMTPAHVAGLKQKQAEVRTLILQDLCKGNFLPTLRGKGAATTEATVVDALGAYDHLALLFSDGDASDGTYGTVAKVQREVNEDDKACRLGFLYIGWSLYNSDCDHAALYQLHQSQYYGLLDPSEDVKEKLSKITSISVSAPHVVVLGRDEDGSISVLLDDPGCRQMSEFGARGYPWNASRLEELKDAEKVFVSALKNKQANLQFLKGADGRDTLFTKDGSEVKVDVLASGGPQAVVGVYFSAHWCPPCRGFTPELAKCHQQLKDAGKCFEVVFVSSDKDEASFQEYMSSMPWLAVPFADRELAKGLNSVFQVGGIPTLILLKPDGTLITDNGRGAISFGAEYFPWGPEEMKEAEASAKKKAEEKRLAALEAESKAIEVQQATGGPVLKRLRGSPGTALTHDAANRTIEFFEFATIGMPDAVTTNGAVYYEVEILDNSGIPQIGFATFGFQTGVNEATGEGVGDDGLSWGFDGTRRCKWFDGSSPWNCEWANGDVLGFAANIGAGKIAVSKNGSWAEEQLGVAFENELIKAGVYPCLTGGHGYKVSYNLNGTSHGPYKHAPPPAGVW